MKFYPVQTIPGREDASITTLRQRLRNFGFESSVGRIEAPTREQREIKPDGSEKVRQQRIMPGYLLIEARMNHELWGCIIGTPGLRKVSRSEQPQALGMHEVARLFDGAKGDDPRAKARKKQAGAELIAGDVVEITAGPFSGYEADVVEALHGNRVRVMVSLFEREVPLELDASDVRLRHR